MAEAYKPAIVVSAYVFVVDASAMAVYSVDWPSRRAALGYAPKERCVYAVVYHLAHFVIGGVLMIVRFLMQLEKAGLTMLVVGIKHLSLGLLWLPIAICVIAL